MKTGTTFYLNVMGQIVPSDADNRHFVVWVKQKHANATIFSWEIIEERQVGGEFTIYNNKASKKEAAEYFQAVHA